jgi:alkylated DNA repair dioxygenase AlkB
MRQAEFAEFERPKLCSVVPGFYLREDFVSRAEERELLAALEHGPWETDWKRRIQQFGLGYGGRHGVRPAWVRDFPEWLANLGRRVGMEAGFEREPENCVINEYIPPQGIAPHSDYPDFGPRISCVSLGSDVVMDLIGPAGEKVHTVVPARSLWVLSGPARTDWKHGIAARLSDIIDGERRLSGRRVSITFRTAARPLSEV